MVFKPFYQNQPEENRNKYHNLLAGFAQLGRMFTDSLKPYLDSRVVEKIFCRVFSAEDKSRLDLSVDAVKIRDGIGIKTFISGSNYLKYEKIAEFVNREKYPIDEKNIEKMVKQIAEYRNFRLKNTIETFDLDNTLYHYLVRDILKIYICECPMMYIDIDSIKIISKEPKGNIIKFSDKYFNYYFHLSKHTLFKQFCYENKLFTIKIKNVIDKTLLNWAIEELVIKEYDEKKLIQKYDYVILPLYSTMSGEVPEKSGLNQWNAGGRKRDLDEVYIPIPAIVHKRKPNFFPSREKKFILKTQDGKKFSAKVCQANNKALMTDPNKELGKWLLRDMLEIPPGEIVTKKHLIEKNVDTVIIYKINENEYQISLHSFGGFEKEYLIEDYSKDNI